MAASAATADFEFEFYRLSAYARSLVPCERNLYLQKLNALNCDDPYLFPPDLWKTDGLYRQTLQKKMFSNT